MPERIRTGTGSISQITPVKANSTANIVTAISTLFSAVNAIIDAFNGLISLGDGTNFGWAGNLDAVEVEYTTPATPDTEFSIPHLLGRVPVRAEVTRKSGPCDVYDSGSVWTDKLVHLKADAGSVLVLLRIS